MYVYLTLLIQCYHLRVSGTFKLFCYLLIFKFFLSFLSALQVEVPTRRVANWWPGRSKATPGQVGREY